MLCSGVMVLAWGYFIWTGSIDTMWPLFGVGNQLLASVALAIGTTILINMGRVRYAWVTLAPLSFLSVMTLYGGFLNIRDNYWPKAIGPDPALQVVGYVDAICTVDHDGVRGDHLLGGRAPMGPGADRQGRDRGSI